MPRGCPVEEGGFIGRAASSLAEHNLFMTAHTRLDPPLVESIRKALTGNALPGETHGLSRDAERAGRRIPSRRSLRERRPGELALAIQSIGGEAGNRRMRIGIVNDDMPFLVNSVANAIAARQLTIHRLLHPVVCVQPRCEGRAARRSSRCARDKAAARIDDVSRARPRRRARPAGTRRRPSPGARRRPPRGSRLAGAAGQMREDARAIGDAEGAALLNWFADGAMTLLGYHVERPYEAPSNALGIFSIPGAPTDEGGLPRTRCAISSRAAKSR